MTVTVLLDIHVATASLASAPSMLRELARHSSGPYWPVLLSSRNFRPPTTIVNVEARRV